MKNHLPNAKEIGKKISVPSEQFLKVISINDWDCKKLNLTEKEKSYFTLTKEWSNKLGRDIIYYRFDEPWRFVLRVRPNIITHKKPVDSDLQSELQILENYITNYDLNHKMNRLVKGYTRYSGWRIQKNPKELNPIKNKSRHLLYQQYVDEMI